MVPFFVPVFRKLTANKARKAKEKDLAEITAAFFISCFVLTYYGNRQSKKGHDSPF